MGPDPITNKAMKSLEVEFDEFDYFNNRCNNQDVQVEITTMLTLRERHFNAASGADNPDRGKCTLDLKMRRNKLKAHPREIKSKCWNKARLE